MLTINGPSCKPTLRMTEDSGVSFAQLPEAHGYRHKGTEGQREYLLQGPALVSLQKSTPLFLSIFSDRPGGRG